MRLLFQLAVILCTLIAFGFAKLSFEKKLHEDMVAENLMQPPLKQGTNLKLGQTSAAVSLGGLRSLVAAFLNLRAFNYFEDTNWIKLEESYEVITTLQPQTTHYWETGAWHLHTNASVHYNESTKLSPIRRKALRSQYINKGSAFLEEGVTQNPDNWKLHLSLARLWSDQYKKPDFKRSLQHYENALATGTMPDYRHKQYSRFRVYIMARIPELRQQTLQEATRLFNKTPDHHLPNLVCILFALQHNQKLTNTTPIPDHQLFPDTARQLHWLKNYWRNRNSSLPMDGVEETILQLEQKQHTQSSG